MKRLGWPVRLWLLAAFLSFLASVASWFLVDRQVGLFIAFVSFLVAAGILLAFYAPAYREEGRRDPPVGERAVAPPRTGVR